MSIQNLISGYYWTYKKGSVGKILYGSLRDANGLFEITGTLTVRASLPGSTTRVIDDSACTPDPDQTANKGQFTWTVDAGAAAIESGTYDLEFKHVDGGVTSFFPDDVNLNKVYGKLIVTETL